MSIADVTTYLIINTALTPSLQLRFNIPARSHHSLPIVTAHISAYTQSPQSQIDKNNLFFYFTVLLRLRNWNLACVPKLLYTTPHARGNLSHNQQLRPCVQISIFYNFAAILHVILTTIACNSCKTLWSQKSSFKLIFHRNAWLPNPYCTCRFWLWKLENCHPWLFKCGFFKSKCQQLLWRD